jgi:hypothetical protein
MAAIIGLAGQQYSAFDPRTIPGCVVWLDGQDPGAFTYSTAPTLTRWANRANGATDAIATGSPTVSTLNGKPAVQLGTGNFFNGAISPTIAGVTVSYFAVVATTVPSTTTAQRLLSMSPATGGEDYNVNTGVLAMFVGQNGTTMTTTRNLVTISTVTGLANNTPFQAAGIYDGTTGQLWKDGVAGTSTLTAAYSFAITKYGVGTMASFSRDYWLGTVGEIIVYSTSLTSVQRVQVEGYLAWKWGLRASLPAGHLYKASPLAMRLLTPYDVVTPPSIWFDAADQSTITGTSPITAWRSKGSQAITGVRYGTGVSTSGISTMNGLNAVEFQTSASRALMTCNNVIFPIQARALFMAYRIDVSAGGQYISVFDTRAPGVNPNGYSIVISNNASYIQLQTVPTTGSRIECGPGQPAEPLGRPMVVGLVHGNSLPNAISINGRLPFLIRERQANGYPTVATTHYLGNAYPSQSYVLGEFVMFNAEFTSIERQQMEGYLAWKWGARQFLPTTHPYSSSPPYVPLFTPLAQPNCVVWFDAADTTTITGTTQVTSWINKGTLGSSATNRVGSCTSGSTVNGLNYVRCPVGADLQFTLALNTQARSWFYVARQVTPLTSGTFAGLLNQLSGTGQNSLVIAYVNATTVAPFMGPTAVGVYVASDVPAATLSSVYMLSVVNSVTVGLNVLTLNGTAQTLKSSVAAGSYRVASSIYLLGTAGYNTAVDIMEAICYYGDVTPSVRQRVEGYLAWKWGLQSSLPATHLYSKFRP